MLLLNHCGMGNNIGDIKCIANFSGQQMSVYVAPTASPNQYQFTICELNRSNAQTFSVYGAFTQNEISTMNLSARVRFPHVEGSKAGEKFYVTFNNDDTWFVINDDDTFGGYSRANELVSGKLPF